VLSAAGGLGLFVLAFGKETRVVMFSRTDAQAAGIHATAVWTGFLFMAAALMTVNFQTVGGLMINGLITTQPLRPSRSSKAAVGRRSWR